MFERVKEEMKTVSGRLKGAQDQIVEQADTLLEQARHKAHIARNEGAERLWHFENQALDWVDDVLERTDVVGGEKVTEPVSRLVGSARERMSKSPIDGYGELNARAAASAVRALGLVELLKIERIEVEGKGRKTVAEAIARRRRELDRPPFRESSAA